VLVATKQVKQAVPVNIGSRKDSYFLCTLRAAGKGLVIPIPVKKGFCLMLLELPRLVKEALSQIA
jgi:hypothetical protein